MPTFSNDQWQEAMVSIANTGISTTPPTDVVATTGSPITADQGVVSANFGAGVASWSVEATGTFSAGTTLFFEFQLTGSGSWYQADRKSTRLNSSHTVISYAVFCLKKKNGTRQRHGFVSPRRSVES